MKDYRVEFCLSVATFVSSLSNREQEQRPKCRGMLRLCTCRVIICKASCFMFVSADWQMKLYVLSSVLARFGFYIYLSVIRRVKTHVSLHPNVWRRLLLQIYLLILFRNISFLSQNKLAEAFNVLRLHAGRAACLPNYTTLHPRRQ